MYIYIYVFLYIRAFKPAVRDRAVRVSKLLGLEASASSQGSEGEESKTGTANNGYSRAPDGEPGQTTAAPSGPPVDLLGGIDSEEEGGKGGVVEGVPVPGEAVRDIVDLLDDDGGGAGGGRSATGGLDDFLGLSSGGGDAESGTRTSAGVAAANASSSDDVAEPAESLFGGLSVKDSGVDGGGGRGRSSDGSGGQGDDEESSGPAPVLTSGGTSGFAFIASAEEPSPDAVPPGGAGDGAKAVAGKSGADLKGAAGSARGGEISLWSYFYHLFVVPFSKAKYMNSRFLIQLGVELNRVKSEVSLKSFCFRLYEYTAVVSYQSKKYIYIYLYSSKEVKISVFVLSGVFCRKLPHAFTYIFLETSQK